MLRGGVSAMRVASTERKIVVPAALLWALAAAPALAGPSSPDLVPLRSGVRIQSIATLAAGGAGSNPCLTPLVQSIRSERQRGTPTVRRALAALVNDPVLPSQRLGLDVDGVTVRFTTDRKAID